ncbi:ADP-ribosylation factor-like protein 6-interacting protein 4 isoform X2 [Saccostrea echinata]|uniref:ADP-ribosylation factor-like protein 6-interacting protein 4 isoform X2 n=1 Tax=Saccostrea echinata TaxID=191078 RepID=UPI002A81554F|nr:ADP-ribosylation factor-like protein 6-interacting protein 4 isoform X2 [Saccostrea echinata]
MESCRLKERSTSASSMIKNQRKRKKSKKRYESSSSSSEESDSDISSSDSSSSDTDDRSRKHKKSKRKRKHKRSRSSSSSSSPSPVRRKKKKKDHKKHKKKKSKKKLKKSKSKERADLPSTMNKNTCIIDKNSVPKPTGNSGPSPRMMKPMTKEEWEKQQSVVRRVYDPETGRNRLVKGDGEILEEIVSKERHKQINKQATQGDGLFFATKMGINKN